MHRLILLAALAAGSLACDQPTGADTAPVIATPDAATRAEYPLAPELANTAPLWITPDITVTWQGSRAIASSEMKFFGNFAELTTGLTIFKGVAEVASLSQTRWAKGFFPIVSALTDEVSRDIGLWCGHHAEGLATGLVEVRAISISSSLTIVLASLRDNARADASQPACPPTPGNGNPYEDGCELCLEWTWYIGNDEVDRYWQCSPMQSCPAQ